MPKYAANLSTAPLQPQKQTGQSGVPQNENINSDKAMNKTWTDPFAANGQECKYFLIIFMILVEKCSESI